MTQLAFEDDSPVWCTDAKLELWTSRSDIAFCGTEMLQSHDLGHTSMDLEQHIHHVKPIAVEKAGRQTPDAECTPKEVSALRSLIGALQWPAAQCCPHPSATASFLQAKMSRAAVLDLVEANRALRFVKNCAGLELQFESLPADFGDWRLGIYADATWASCPDGFSPGGYLVFIGAAKDIEQGKAMPLTDLDWASRKLPRTCRSSISAEAQAGSRQRG